MTKHISTEVSKTALSFEPGSPPESFTVTVYNDSYKTEDSRFASFQLTLLAAGQELKTSNEWYRLVPAVSYKIPPGDRTQFEVQILDVPPLSENFTGTLNLTARVYSPELRDEDRKDIRLVVKGGNLSPPKITLPEQTFTGSPGDAVKIEVLLYNPNRKSIDSGIQLKGLPPEWLPEGQQKSLLLQPGEQAALSFDCRIPAPAQAPSQQYPLTFDIVRPVAVTAIAQANLTVLPVGTVTFSGTPTDLSLPAKKRRWLNPRYSEAAVDLSFNNQSNLTLEGGVTVTPPALRGGFSGWRRRKAQQTVEASFQEAASVVNPTLDPEQVTMRPGETAPLTLRILQRLPWLGWRRVYRFQVEPFLAEPLDDPLIELENTSPEIALHTDPVIPVWLQLVGAGVSTLLLAVVFWFVGYRGHRGPVNAVQISGQGNEAISASIDGTLRRWQIQGRRLIPTEVIRPSDKSIRTAHYRPVQNDEVAAGFENGTAQIIDVFSDQTFTFEATSGDRVLALAFSQDARALFSAQGSGVVHQWPADPSQRQRSQTVPVRSITVEFAPYALALLDEDTQLAIAGEENQFVIADLAAEEIVRLPYTPGGKTDLILDMATAEAHPNRLAVADDQGRISLWNMAVCRQSPQSCEPIAEWLGHGGQAVRAVALSQDGCYLASAGDDGRVMLWPLTPAGYRQPQAIDGHRLRQSAKSVNAVDIMQRHNTLHVVSGGDDYRVRVSRRQLRPALQPGACSADRLK